MATATAMRVADAPAQHLPAAPAQRGTVYVTCEELRRGLSRAKGALSPRRALWNALESVRVYCDGRSVCLETTCGVVSARIELDAHFSGEFDELVRFGALWDALKGFGKRAILVLSHHRAGAVAQYKMEIRCNNTRFSLLGSSWKDWSRTEWSEDAGALLHVVGEEFALAIAGAALQAGRDATRPILSSVHLEGTEDGRLEIVATDSHRLLVECTGGALGDFKATLPAQELARAVHGLKANEGVRMSAGTRLIFFERSGERWAFVPVNGQYPDYRSLIPSIRDVAVRLQFVREELAEAVHQALLSIRGMERQSPMRISLQADGVRIGTRSVGEELFSTSVTATRMRVVDVGAAEVEYGVDPALLGDLLDVLPGECVTLGLIAPLSPILLYSGDDRAVVMPVRL